MNIIEIQELTNKYGVCAECKNDKVGGSPLEGTLTIEKEVFTRTCKCGWSVTVDKRIKHIYTMEERVNGKLQDGYYQVYIANLSTSKKLPIKKLREVSGIKQTENTRKVDEWLNSNVGREWALGIEEFEIANA